MIKKYWFQILFLFIVLAIFNLIGVEEDKIKAMIIIFSGILITILSNIRSKQ